MMLSYIHEGCVRTSAGPSLRLARQVGRSVRITLTIAWHALVLGGFLNLMWDPPSPPNESS